MFHSEEQTQTPRPSDQGKGSNYSENSAGEEGGGGEIFVRAKIYQDNLLVTMTSGTWGWGGGGGGAFHSDD